MDGSDWQLVLSPRSGAASFATVLHVLLQSRRFVLERRELAQVWLRITMRGNCARISDRCVTPGVRIADFASCRHRLRCRRVYIRNFPILWHRSTAATGRLPRWRRRRDHRSTAVHFGTGGLLRRIFAVCDLFWRCFAGDGAEAKMESAWNGRGLGGICGHGAQRNARRAAWTCRWRRRNAFGTVHDLPQDMPSWRFHFVP